MRYNLSRRFQKLFSLLQHPSLWRVVPLGVFPGLEHASAFKEREYDLIVDVGANKGQFATFALTRWPSAQIVCFEPLPHPRKVLTSVLNRIAPTRASIRAKALGQKIGTSIMHIATREDCSSLLKLSPTQQKLFNMAEAGTVTIDIGRLDSEPKIFEHDRTLLKIDVQGFEYEVLVGAGEKLQQFSDIYVECAFVELYEGQKIAQQVTDFLKENGFTEMGQFNIDVIEGKLIQADLLFQRNIGSPSKESVPQ